MGTLLVTVVYGRRRRDLAVPSDVPVADLLAPLADALTADGAAPTHDLGANPAGTGRAGDSGPAATHSRGGDLTQHLALAPVCEGPLPFDRSLAACGVGHGAVLVLVAGAGDAGGRGR